MRKLVLLLVFSLVDCAAQSAGSKSLEVQSIGVVYFLDSSSQTMKPLPEEMFKIGHSSVFKTAYAGAAMIASDDVSGGRSSFRLSTGKPEFVFRFGTPENAKLYVSTQNKNQRRFAAVRVNKDNSVAILPGIPVEITQFGESSYKMVPQSSLSPGEYSIILAGSAQAKSRTLFTFGID